MTIKFRINLFIFLGGKMRSLKKLTKKAFGFSLATFAFLFATPVFAQEAQAIAEGGISVGQGLKYLAIGLTFAIAAAGCAIGEGLAAGRALESIGRNPSAKNIVFIYMLIVLALIEALAFIAFALIFLKLS
jgi:F-type H+-transporting ATPase subunit c